MAEAIVWGDEQELCRNPKLVDLDGQPGCGHYVQFHSEYSEGCSRIGAVWCPCTWYPTRTGAARERELQEAKAWTSR